MNGEQRVSAQTPSPEKLNASARTLSAATPGDEQERLSAISSELRCLVCQNQSIADSTSGLAMDLRQQIQEQIQAGKSDTAITQYMAERYGDFVLYKPKFSVDNAALWAGPFILLMVGVWVVLRAIKRRGRFSPPLDPPPDQTRLKKIEERYKRDAK